jgi:hypothetical protein
VLELTGTDFEVMSNVVWKSVMNGGGPFGTAHACSEMGQEDDRRWGKMMVCRDRCCATIL